MNTLNKSLNKGVPTDVNIDITFTDFLNLSSNSERTLEILNETIKKYFARLSAATGKSFNFFFTNRLVRVNTDPNELEKYITVSPVYLLGMLDSGLNINNIWATITKGGSPTYGDASEEEYRERLAALGKVSSKKQLQRQFPCIFQAYSELLALKSKLDFYKKQSLFTYMSAVKQYDLTKYDLELLDKVESFPDYMQYVQETFTTMYEQIDELSALATQDRINSRVFGRSSAERLELYVADRYATMALHPSTELSEKQKCSYYLSAYIFENLDKLDDGRYVERLITNMAGKSNVTERITKRNVYEKFKKLLIENPELLNINLDNHIFEGMSIDETNKLMAGYMQSIKTKWDIIPSGHDIIFTSTKRDKESTKTPNIRRTKNDPTELFYQKKAFFDSSDPFIRVLGKDTFNGYIGYIYPNGTVILDKFYEDSKTKKLAEDVAIYCMNIDDFYRLSQLSKSDIIRDRLCKRFYHRGDWQSRVQKEITGTALTNIDQKTYVLRQLSEASN